MNSKYKNLIKDTAIFAMGNMGSKIILFLLVPLYTNYLTTEEYGIAELIFTIAQLVVPFISIAINEAVLRYGLMKGIKRENVIVNGFIVFLLSTLLSIVITPLFSFYTAVSDWRWYLCAYNITCAATTIFTSYLKVKDKNKLFAGVSIIQTAVLAAMNIILLTVFHIGIKGYLIANITAHAVAALIAVIGGNIVRDLKHGTYNRQLFQKMLVYSAPLIINSVSWWIIHSSDKIMVELMITASALGLYTVAAKIPALINVVITIFTQAWSISSIKEVESTNDVKYYSNVFSMYRLLTFFMVIVLISIIKPFMNIYVGAGFKEAWIFVPLLLVSAVFSSISAYYGSLFAALKKSVNNMSTTLIAAVINIAINYVGIKLVGVWGAIIGTLIAYVVIAFMRMYGVHKEIKIQIDYKVFYLNIVIILCQAILVSIDFYRVYVSMIAIILFVIFNYVQMKDMAIAVKHILVKK